MAVDVGCGRGYIAKDVYEDMVGLLYQCDMAENILVSRYLPLSKCAYICEFIDIFSMPNL